jgi:putative ABC transport system ATP-binding protein|nr:ABC transporter ATP-binding protein [Panacagrimonas sp.]
MDMARECGWAVRAHGVAHEISSGEKRLTILDGVDLEIAQGQSVAIVGRSGSGKTTLLSMLAGLDRPTRGTVELAGTDLGPLDEDGRARLRAGRVGFVFQSFQLLAGFTALENARLGADLAGHADAADRAQASLAQVGLSARATHLPHQLSGGEQQRVAIARAFAAGPSILFADEPTGNLDSVTGAEIIDLLFLLNGSRHTTLVLVTHDEGLARRCDRVLTLRNGRLDA